MWARPKLQALVYDILPLTTAVFSYAIGSRKLSANEQYFVGVQTVASVTNNSNKTRRVIYSRHQFSGPDGVTKYGITGLFADQNLVSVVSRLGEFLGVKDCWLIC